MRFSERIGKNAPRKSLQAEGLDQATRGRLWNVVSTYLPTPERQDWEGHRDRTLRDIVERVYDRLFKKPFSEIDWDSYDELEKLEAWFTKDAEWFEAYDFLELVGNADEFLDRPYGLAEGCAAFRAALDTVLAEELAGVRFIDRKLAPVTSPQEIVSLETAIASPITSVSQHFREAIAVLSDRRLKDYRNSVKESISAVEAAARAVTGQPKATLSDALKTLQRKHGLHPALEQALTKLYAFASDANGIRHALTDEGTPVDRDLAKFMLVTCSAFCGLLVSAGESAA